MAMNELQRQAYLRELGIQTYFPRRALPGAKPSRLFGASVLHVEVSGADPSQQHSSDQRARLLADSGVPSAPFRGVPKVIFEAMSGVTAAVPSTVAPAVAPEVALVVAPEARSEPARKVAMAPAAMPTPAAPVAVPASAAPPRFAFAYFPVSDELAVINELPWAKSAAVSPACRQLLAGMLRALGMPNDERALTSMVFTWPLLEGPDIDQGEESARQTLSGFLARRLKLRPVRHLLVLAEQSAGYLFPAEFDWQQGNGELQRHPLFDMKVVVTRSLNAMDAVPDLKREVWQAMQPLRQALANSSAAPSANPLANPSGNH